MSFYKICRNPNEFRTEDYRFSVLTKSDPDLLALKSDVKKHNAEVRARVRDVLETRGKERAMEYLNLCQLHRVRLMARGARAKHARANGLNPRAWDSFIPHEYAEYFDVYRGSDSNAMYWFRDQIETGVTPSQRAAIRKAQFAIMAFTMKEERKLRNIGLKKVYYTNGYGRPATKWEAE